MSAEQPVCQVCGTGIDEAPHLCPRCETPHHEDCWRYTGRCSVYACMVVAEGHADAPVVPVGANLPAPLAATAALVPAIVPLPAPGAGAAVVWAVDAHGAWLGARDPAVPVAPGETVMMLTPGMRACVKSPQSQGHDDRVLTWIVGYLASVAVAATCGSGPLVPMFGFLAVLLAAVGLAVTNVVPDRAWITRGPKGLWFHADSDGARWEVQLSPGRWPRRVRLRRSREDAWGESGRMRLTYRLMLEWQQQIAHGRDAFVEYPLSEPMQMPDTPDERRPLLEQVVARRALGQHIAAALSIPFEEGI